MKRKILQIKEQPLQDPKAFFITALLLFSAIVVLLSVLLDPTRQYDPNRHQYDPETRVEGSLGVQGEASGFFAPDEYLFHESVIGADIIVEGKVISDGMGTFYQVNPNRTDGPSVSSMAFTFEVRDTWYGECEDVITLRMLGGFNSGITKPYVGDELILFLFENSNGEYVPVFFEHSIYAINPPDNRIYAFSNREPLAALDGLTVSQFRNRVARALNEFRAIANEEQEESIFSRFSIGTVGNSVLDDDNPLKQVESEETE